MPGWLRSAWLAACVATACVVHSSGDSLSPSDLGGAGGEPSAGTSMGGTTSGATTAGAAGSVAANGGAANAGAATGGTATGGNAGAAALGGGGGGSGGDSGGESGAAGAAGAAAEPGVIALAKLEPTTGTTVTGEARFEQTGDLVKLSVTLTNCPAGAHALHLHQNPDCSDDANASGGTWSPQGEGIGEVTCADDGTGALEFSPAAGTWSIGGLPASDLLRHSVVLHAGGKSEAAGRIACGLPLLQP